MRFAVKPWLLKIWYAPEHIRILDPLPAAHRRGIIASVLFIAVCLLWPVKSPPLPQPQVISLDNPTTQPLQANLVISSQHTRESEHQSQPAAIANHSDASDSWRTYRIAPGQTMAQLFRDNNLSPTDVYAMAQVEGNDKPLSNLKTGQTVHIRENKEGIVTGLSIEDWKNNEQVNFIRQQDGRFILER